MLTEEIVSLLAQLADEQRPARSINLIHLSDLTRAQARDVHARLSLLSPRRRLELVSTMAEQSEVNVHLNFHALFRECLTDAEAAVRKVAIEGLWEDERPTLVNLLVELLGQDPDGEVRTAAASSLGRFVLLGVLGEIAEEHAQRAEQALWAAWSRPGEGVEVRRRALESLAYTEREQINELIELAYYDEHDLMRQSAVFAMGRTANPRWARPVLAELNSSDPAMRFEAANAAGELGLKAAVKPLIRLLDDGDGAVRETAALALGKIGGPEAQRALRACVNARDQRLAEAAADALAELAFNSGTLDNVLFDFSPAGDWAKDEEDGLAGWDDEWTETYDEDESDLEDEEEFGDSEGFGDFWDEEGADLDEDEEDEFGFADEEDDEWDDDEDDRRPI